MTASTSCCNFRHLSMKWSTSMTHRPSGHLLQSTGSQLRTLHSSARIFFILPFNVCCQLLRSASVTSTARASSGTACTSALTRGCTLLYSAGKGTPRSHQLLQTEASSSSCSDATLALMFPLILSSFFFT